MNDPHGSNNDAATFMTMLIISLNVAANNFCTSLEFLSRILKTFTCYSRSHPPSLGNGASDVFASIVSFTISGNGGFGLNSILGGAFFISSAVDVCAVAATSHFLRKMNSIPFSNSNDNKYAGFLMSVILLQRNCDGRSTRQGAQMDGIEHHVMNARRYVKDTSKELNTAKHYQRGSRKCMYIIGIFLLLAIVLVILILVVTSFTSS
ncbi:putative Sodium/potassium/calcium exchanger 6 precursor [Corchorus olitorius]|uniref:Sodium/potassium/calcium exchanger 6 n=1 Tax=Corchorus olitorius TaxID=93759 RepID=A0A1R3IZ15_9ROSI|nr:putative Sodium/potassium/calcium exchanger 6 precursor [Corchorus olitorius]